MLVQRLGAAPRRINGLLLLKRGYAAQAKSASVNNPRVEVQHLGIATDVYIHPKWANMPSMLTHPLMRLRGFGRKVISLFQMTAMVAQFRLKSKLKPRFVEWKNLALENYVAVNKAFARNQLDSVQNDMSIWVYESLKSRLKSIPPGTRLDWKLIKFNATPKIAYLQPMMIPDSPMSHIQIIYRIESRQRLVKIAPGSKTPEVSERDVTDYVGYVIDAGKTPAQVVMSGSVFETPLTSPRPDVSKQDSEGSMVRSMKEKGDIFRPPPRLLAIKA